MKRTELGVWVLFVLIAWGVLSFGAVYPWAYTPLLAGAALAGVWGWVSGDPIDRRKLRPLAIALALAIVVILWQLIPLPRTFIVRVSPGADAFLRGYDAFYANRVLAGAPVWHALSIMPALTWRGLAMFVPLAVFLLGATVLVSRMRVSGLVRALVGLGLLVAIFGVVQHATFNRRLYWVWAPVQDPANAFGPFVNRNHFAGWMVMTALLSGGYLCALVARAGAHDRSWRRRIAWLGSDDASWLVFASFACAAMAMSIVWTLSRSGIAALAAGSVLLGARAARDSRGARGIVAAALFLAMIGFAVTWKGFDVVASRYGETSTLAWRIRLWHDTLPIVRDFWWSGTGLDTFGVSTLVYPMSDTVVHANEAHNDYLQILSEGGVVLSAIVVLIIGLIARRIRRAFVLPQPASTRWIRAGATAGLIAIAIQEISDFSLQLPGNAVLFIVLAAVAMHRAPDDHARVSS